MVSYTSMLAISEETPLLKKIRKNPDKFIGKPLSRQILPNVEDNEMVSPINCCSKPSLKPLI